MESLLILAAIAIIAVPIINSVIVSGISSKLSDVERGVRNINENLSAINAAVRRLEEHETTLVPPDVGEKFVPEPPKETVEETAAPPPGEPVVFEYTPPRRWSVAELLKPSDEIPSPPEEENIDEPVTAEISEESAEPEEPSEVPADDFIDEPESDEILDWEDNEEEDEPEPEKDEAIEERVAAAVAYAPPRVSAEPAEPSWFELRWRRAVSWLLTEGNIWVSIGVLLFLAGFGLLFSYVAQMNLVSLEMRLAGSGVVGIAMAAFGWRMREKRRTYALVLQGGGIGVLYIVLLAGAKLGPVIPVPAAVVGMVLLCAFTIILALMQNYELLACFALLGGFAAPILVSTGSSNFVALFSIHSLLNIEILFIAARRDWRMTRWGGFIASTAVGLIWGWLRWRPEYFASVEPFIILLFATYAAVTTIPLLPRSKWITSDMTPDRPMIFSLPFVFLFLQIPAASHTAYGVALSCLALGAYYLAMGHFLTKQEGGIRGDFEPGVFLAYCILFSNLAVPFIFRQAMSSAIWAIEGTVLIAYAAKRGKSAGTLMCGILLHAAAFVMYNFMSSLHLPLPLHLQSYTVHGLLDWRRGTSPFLLTGLIFAASSLAASWFSTLLKTNHETGKRVEFHLIKSYGFSFKVPEGSLLSYSFAVYGTLWWTLAVWHTAFVSLRMTDVSAFSILSLGGALAYAASHRLRWTAARFLCVPPLANVLLIATGILVSSMELLNDTLNPALPNWLTYAALFTAVVYVHRREDASDANRSMWGLMLFSFLYYTAALPSRWGSGATRDWLYVMIGFIPVFAASALFTIKRFKERTGLSQYERESVIAISLVLLTRLPSFIASLASPATGIAAFYIPVLNPLELWQVAYLTCVALMLARLRGGRWNSVAHYGMTYAMPAAGFVLVNTVAARAAFRYFGERVLMGSFSNAPHFQGIVAILWGLTALALIFGGKRYASRLSWYLGAGLLALDIAKLMLIDLSNSATVIRIVAFLVLGGLFLTIGWVAPLPPKAAATRKINGEHDEKNL